MRSTRGRLQAYDFALDLPGGRRELEARVAPSGPNEVTAIVRDFTDVRAVEAEVRRSRARIVEATDEERRRLERDLHDGAQQRLVSVSLALRRVRSSARRRAGADAEALAAADEAATELKLAIQELRELARGIHPAILTEAGLGAAITALAERSAVPATVRSVPDRRLPPAVEATAYFVVSEALANVAKHAHATSVSIAATATADDPPRRGRRRRRRRRRCRERDRHPRAPGSRRRDRRHAQDREPARARARWPSPRSRSAEVAGTGSARIAGPGGPAGGSRDRTDVRAIASDHRLLIDRTPSGGRGRSTTMNGQDATETTSLATPPDAPASSRAALQGRADRVHPSGHLLRQRRQGQRRDRQPGRGRRRVGPAGLVGPPTPMPPALAGRRPSSLRDDAQLPGRRFDSPREADSGRACPSRPGLTPMTRRATPSRRSCHPETQGAIP